MSSECRLWIYCSFIVFCVSLGCCLQNLVQVYCRAAVLNWSKLLPSRVSSPKTFLYLLSILNPSIPSFYHILNWISFFCRTQNKVFWRMLQNKKSIYWTTYYWSQWLFFSSMQHSSSVYFPLCSTDEMNSNRFWANEGRVNDCRIFERTIPLSLS